MKIKLKPLGWVPSILLFLAAAGILRVAHYGFAALYKQSTGSPYLVGYLIAWGSTMALVFAASLVVYKLEGRPFKKEAFTARFRLERLGRADWLWTLAMIAFAVLSLAALSFTQPVLKTLPFFAPHPAFPPDMVDIQNLTPGVLFEMPLKGKWWVAGVYLVGWFLNIAGEEFWYRGWMLPRQEIAFGKYAWIINGLMFTFQHTFQFWNVLALLPGSLFLSYGVQRQKKTWMSIIWHGLLNVSLLLFIIQGVVG